MVQIPSIENTDDYIFRAQIDKGTLPRTGENPNILTFVFFVEPTGPLHSVDFVILRDGQRANDIEFRIFKHLVAAKIADVRFKFFDHAHPAMEHDYLLTVILRYLI